MFREPEAFLQFLVFTERGEGEDGAVVPARVPAPDVCRGALMAKRSPFAFPGKRPGPPPARAAADNDVRIDFVPYGDAEPEVSKKDEQPVKNSSEISFAERRAGKK